MVNRSKKSPIEFPRWLYLPAACIAFPFLPRDGYRNSERNEIHERDIAAIVPEIRISFRASSVSEIPRVANIMPSRVRRHKKAIIATNVHFLSFKKTNKCEPNDYLCNS